MTNSFSDVSGDASPDATPDASQHTEQPAVPPTLPPLTSVVVVTYQTGKVFGACIKSLLAQNSPVEIIIVNNGNPPDFEDNLAKYVQQEPRLKLITGHGNVGFAKACNMGAAQATGNFIAFVNPDCRLPPDAFSKMIMYAARIKGRWMMGARIVDDKGRDQRGSRRALLTPKTAIVEFFRLHKWFPKLRFNLHLQPLPKKPAIMPAISGAFIFMPKTDFEWIKGFDEGYFLHVEDLDLCLRFTRAGGRIIFIPDVVVAHTGGTSKVANLFVEKHKARGFVRYFHENFGHEWTQPLLWLLYLGVFARYFLMVCREKIKRKPR